MALPVLDGTASRGGPPALLHQALVDGLGLGQLVRLAVQVKAHQEQEPVSRDNNPD